MQRHEMIDAMRALGLKGMASAFDEAVTTGVQRQRTTPEILTDLLRAEAAHRHAASIRSLSERMLWVELDDHLEAESAEGAINRCNGSSRKTMLTRTSKVRLEVPRKYQRRFPKFNDKVVSMYARAASRCARTAGTSKRITGSTSRLT